MGMLERLEEDDLGVKEGDCWCAALFYALDIVLLADSVRTTRDVRHDGECHYVLRNRCMLLHLF